MSGDIAQRIKRADEKREAALKLVRPRDEQRTALKDAESDFANLEKEALQLNDERQKDWFLAHYGAALLHSFEHHTNTEENLDKAEKRLREALGVGRNENGSDPLDAQSVVHKSSNTGPHARAWAWARLGECLRLKGNLAPFYIEPSDRVLRVRPSEVYYEKSALCFDLARDFRQGYEWALAHWGAMLINRRRYDSVGRSQAEKARRLLEAALGKRTGSRYPWALFYKGGSYFLSVMDSLIDSLERGEIPSAQHHREISALLMGHSMVVALMDDTSSLFQYPVHPGAIGRDEYLTLCYDLLDYLPRLSPQRTPKETYERFLALVTQAMVAGFRFVIKDDHLKGSEHVRFSYALVYVCFWAYKDHRSVGMPEEFARGLFKYSMGQLPDLASDIKDAIVRTVNVLFNAGKKPAGVPVEELANKWGLDSPSAAETPAHLLRQFDIIMIFLKLGVISKTVNGPTLPFNKALEALQKKYGLNVLKKSVEGVHDLYMSKDSDNSWLLAPQWVLDRERRLVLKQFLNCQDVEEPK